MQQSMFLPPKSTSSQSKATPTSQPLADILRPTKISDYIGQAHLMGDGGVVRRMIESGNVFSMILWGPPGVGKTTLAKIIANESSAKFYQVSAVSAGKADLKFVVDAARDLHAMSADRRVILFVDEIHRFNKAQQDYLLPYVEDGTVVLIGATTENPSFEVNSALLSRVKVYVLNQFSGEEMSLLLQKADAYYAEHKNLKIVYVSNAKEVLIELANYDPRTLINGLEMIVNFAKRDKDGLSISIDKPLIEKVWHTSLLKYDKNGEEHYNIISALHKSMRSSDVDAAVYWTVRMLAAGEDPIYLARRLMRFASEDVGNADPQAVILANAVFDGCKKIGMPECQVMLVQLAIYLSRAAKDNSAYVAERGAMQDVQKYGNLPVPLHIRNAPTKLMRDLNYGKGYVYDHDLPSKKSNQQCLPDKLQGRKYLG